MYKTIEQQVTAVRANVSSFIHCTDRQQVTEQLSDSELVALVKYWSYYLTAIRDPIRRAHIKFIAGI